MARPREARTAERRTTTNRGVVAFSLVALTALVGCASGSELGGTSGGGSGDAGGAAGATSGPGATSGHGATTGAGLASGAGGASASATSGATSGSGAGVPSLTIESGDGGVVPSGWPAGDPLRVRLCDGGGQPIANATVTFTNTGGEAIHIQAFGDVATTDADGIASTTYNAFPIDGNEGMEIDEVTASSNGLSAVFHVIITQVPAGWPGAPPLVDIGTPDTAPDYGTAHAGTTVVGALRANAVIQQGPSYGQPVPGWGLRITSASDTLEPAAVGCAGGTVISDASGDVACDLVVPATPGDYYFSVLAGGAVRFDSGHLHVVP